jgi:hypothetical protein
MTNHGAKTLVRPALQLVQKLRAEVLYELERAQGAYLKIRAHLINEADEDADLVEFPLRAKK